MDVAGESNNEVKLRRDAGQRVFYSRNGPKYLRTGCEEGNGTELTTVIGKVTSKNDQIGFTISS